MLGNGDAFCPLDERAQTLIETRLDYSNIPVFPTKVQEALSQIGFLPTWLSDWLASTSRICWCAKNAPASDEITTRVYDSGEPSPLQEGEVDQWISYGPGGRALYRRLPRVSSWVVDWLTQRPSANILDLGGGHGRYAFQSLKKLEDPTGIHWECIDFDSEAIRRGEYQSQNLRLQGNVHFRQANFMSSSSYPSPGEAADFALLIGVLCSMSIPDATRCLVKIKPHIKKGGELLAATLLHTSFLQDPWVYQVLFKMGWHLKPKTMDEVGIVFDEAGYKVLDIFSESLNGEGQYAIVHAISL